MGNPEMNCMRAAVMMAAVLVASTVHAQGFPSKPVRLVVPFAAGGTVDTIARVLASKYSETWKQAVVVDNRPGAGTVAGAEQVARSAPDGHTLLLNVQGMAIIPSLYRKLPFDPIKDFAPVSQLISTYTVLVANPKLPANTVQELIALARAQPGKLNYGSTGLGAPPHLTMEMFKSITGTDIVHIPYKGDALQIPALLAGEVQLAFTPLTAAQNYVKSGKLRILGMTGTHRAKDIPDVPTMVEAGVPNFTVTGWTGLFAAGGTDREIVNRISADTARIVNQAEVRDRLAAMGYDALGSTPEEFAKTYRADIVLYSKAVKDARVPQLD
jgi:tripartite-type tricarboxylate transporter receptor subunit TctC